MQENWSVPWDDEKVKSMLVDWFPENAKRRKVSESFIKTSELSFPKWMLNKNAPPS